MDQSILDQYKELHKLQAEQIELLSKRALHHKEALQNLEELVAVQERLIKAQKRQIRQLTGTHLKVIK